MTHHDPRDLTAHSRAGRAIANYRARHESWSLPVWEAEQEGIESLRRLAMAAIAVAADLGDQLHGDRAQVVLDRHALNAAGYEEEHSGGPDA